MMWKLLICLGFRVLLPTWNIVPIFVALIQSLLHQRRYWSWTYLRKNFKFRMELVTSMPLYSMAMPQFIIIITKAPFISTLVNIVIGIRSKSQIPRGIEFVSLHEDMLQEVNKVFTSKPLDQRGGNLDPPRPPRYFGLLMVHLIKPPLPPNRPHCLPHNYLEYVKNFDLDAHVRVFKAAIRTNSEINDVEIVNLFIFTFRNTMSN